MLPLLVAGGAAIALANVLAGRWRLPAFSLLLLGAVSPLRQRLFLAGSRIGRASQDRVDHCRSMRIPRLRRRTLERRPRGFGPVRADASVRHGFRSELDHMRPPPSNAHAHAEGLPEHRWKRFTRS